MTRVQKWLEILSIPVPMHLYNMTLEAPSTSWGRFLHPLESGLGHVTCFVQWDCKKVT